MPNTSIRPNASEPASILLIALFAGSLFTILLYMWRITYMPAGSDWAGLFLVPLAFILFVGFRTPLASMLLARSSAIVRRDSWISVFVTGKIKATVLSIFFVAVTLPIIAWEAMRVDGIMALAHMLLVLAASFMGLGFPRFLKHHVHHPFSEWYGMMLGAGITALVFVPIVSYVNWSHVTHSGEFLSLGFWDAIRFGLSEQLPDQRGVIAEILAFPVAIESAQLWLVAGQTTSAWAPMLYSLYLAMVVILIAQASAAMALFANNSLMKSVLIRQSKTERQNAKKSNTASLAFWGTLLFLAGITVGVALIGFRIDRQGQVSELNSASDDPEPGLLLELGIDWSQQVYDAISDLGTETAHVLDADLSPYLSDVYGPVYAAIPEYADFHYSLLGEYIELSSALQGKIDDGLRDWLFNEFELRMESTLTRLDRRFAEEYKLKIEDEIRGITGSEESGLMLGRTMQLAMDDAVTRATVSYPLAGAASVVGSGGLKALAAGIAPKIGTSLAAKVGVKTAAKGGSVLAGGGTGIAVCSWGGPIALACGVGGAAAAWFLADAAIINIDEFFNRDEFETELRAMIDEDKAEKERLITEALHHKGQQLDKEIAADFRFRELRQTVLD